MEKLKKYIETIPHIALTTDLWKNKKQEYFLTLTGHFLTDQNEYESIILSFRKFNKLHNADNISQFIIKELDELNIQDKIVSITSDNEAAVKKAINLIGEKNKNIEWISCMCHNLNLTVKNGLKLWSKEKM